MISKAKIFCHGLEVNLIQRHDPDVLEQNNSVVLLKRYLSGRIFDGIADCVIPETHYHWHRMECRDINNHFWRWNIVQQHAEFQEIPSNFLRYSAHELEKTDGHETSNNRKRQKVVGHNKAGNLKTILEMADHRTGENTVKG